MFKIKEKKIGELGLGQIPRKYIYLIIYIFINIF